METNNINDILQLLTNFLLYSGVGAIGVTTRDLLFPEDNNIRENFGLCLFTGIVITSCRYFLKDAFPDIIFYMVLSLIAGFFLPGFKEWLRGKKILSLLIKAKKKAKSIESAALDAIEEEITPKT